IDDYQVEFPLELGYLPPERSVGGQAPLEVLDAIERGARRDDGEVLLRRRGDSVPQAGLAGVDRGDVRLEPLVIHDIAREVGLRIDVDHEYARPGARPGGREGQGRGRFADTALLLGDAEYFHLFSIIGNVPSTLQLRARPRAGRAVAMDSPDFRR